MLNIHTNFHRPREGQNLIIVPGSLYCGKWRKYLSNAVTLNLAHSCLLWDLPRDILICYVVFETLVIPSQRFL